MDIAGTSFDANVGLGVYVHKLHHITATILPGGKRVMQLLNRQDYF
jgi:hypothetical protein